MSPLNSSLNTTSSLSTSQVVYQEFFQIVKHPRHHNLIVELNQYFLNDSSQLPRLLNTVIQQLKQQKISTLQAREITATACCVVAEYVNTYVYNPKDEKYFKQVISLLNALIYGAVKIPKSEDLSEPEPSNNYIEKETSEIRKIDGNTYGLVALIGIKALLEKVNINNDFLLLISIFECLDWSQVSPEQQTIMTNFLKNLNFIGVSPEEMEFISLLQKYGWREVLSIAEFQYRKNQYINLKSRFNEDENAEKSPIEFLEEPLSIFQQKLKDSLSSLMVLEEATLEFGSEPSQYLNCFNRACSAQDKLMIVFHGLTKMCLDGMYQNAQARQHIEQGIQFSTKAQELYKTICSQWSHQLSELTRLTVAAKVITTPNGHKMKKTVLDWPLSSFFPEQQGKRGKITQTVLKEKVDMLSLEDCANLLVLLYCNIQETANPLGQVNNLYAAFREKLTLTNQDHQFTHNYLEARGFSPHQISGVLEFQEDV
ncbi:MAG: hypothetical protein AB4041_18820 [Microcystaceae cyanobacterium]